jgi:hypothetical protein
MICPQDINKQYMISTKKWLKYIIDDINTSGLIMIGRCLIYHIILDKLILSYSSFNLLL